MGCKARGAESFSEIQRLRSERATSSYFTAREFEIGFRTIGVWRYKCFEGYRVTDGGFRGEQEE